MNAPHPAISVLKRVATSATGPWFDFLSVAPTTPLYYQFTAENTGDVALNPFSVSDPTLAGTGADPAGCVWQTTNLPTTLPALPVATATIDPTATCVVGPISATLRRPGYTFGLGFAVRPVGGIAGVAVGGRTGLASIVTAALFLLSPAGLRAADDPAAGLADDLKKLVQYHRTGGRQ